MFIPKDPRRWWEVKGTLRVVIRNGIDIVYEGWIPNLQDRMNESELGVNVNFMGAFGWFLLNRQWRKRWADDRTTEQPWQWQTAATAADICTINRLARLRFLPKAEAWADGEYAAVRYDMSFDGIARVTYTYDLQEAAQAWEISLWRSADGSSWTQMTAGSGETYNTGTTTVIAASGTASIDVEPASGTKYLEFRYYARAAQTPTSDGAYYANITSLMVYSEDEGAVGINLATISADAVADFSTMFNSDTQYIDTASTVRVIEPFISSGDSYEGIGSILTRAADFGDGDENSWAVGCYNSEKATTPNGKPVLFCEQYPVTTTYDLFISPETPAWNSINITRDFERELFNYATVEYRDESGKQQFVTPTDDASLTDATSVAAYGQRDIALRVGNSTSANAIDYGARFISKHKDPRYLVDDFTVVGSIEGAGGQPIAACRIKAGMRIKIDGYDTFIISRTEYDHKSRSCTIGIGEPKEPGFTETVFDVVWNDPTPQEEGGVVRDPKAWFIREDLMGYGGRKKMRDYDREHGTDTWGDFKREKFPFKKKPEKSKKKKQ